MSEANPYASPQISGKDMMTGPGQLASLGDRFLGALIDGLIAIPISFALGFALGIVLAMTPLKDNFIGMQIVSNLMGFGMGIGIFLAIHGYLLSTRGQTVGKMVMKTQIVQDDGSPIPFGPLMLKRYLPIWIASAIPCLGLIYILVDVLMIFRETRKCLHDDIAGTKVIKLAG